MASCVQRIVTRATRLLTWPNGTRPVSVLSWRGVGGDDCQKGVPRFPSLSPCSCGCTSARLHTKGDKELVDFLNEEIEAERKLSKSPKLPTNLDSFNIKLDGAKVKLVKTFNDETVEVSLNVNNSVDSEGEPDVNPQIDQPEIELTSKPDFTVEISRDGRVLSFSCSYIEDHGDHQQQQQQQQQQQDQGYDDIFHIYELSMYDKEFKDNTYTVSGDVLDGCLYDLLMNMLEERGVSNEFVNKLSDFSTNYEHHLYISLLDGLRSFVSKK